MRQYKYVAVNLQKEKFHGNFIAKDEADLSVQLSKQGLFLVSATPYNGKAPSSFFTLGTGKVTLHELTTFCRQYAIMINSGISLLGGIEILKEQNFSALFKSLLQLIYEDVKAGMMLSDAMAKHKNVFPVFFRSMIRVGESSGRLDVVMNSLADYYEKDTAIKKKAKSALAYPTMLLVLTVGIVIVMLAFVIPTFRESLSSLEVEITGITKVVYDTSDFLLANWQKMLLGALGVVAVLFLIGKTKKGSYFYDWLKVNVPLLKNITINMVTSRFSRGFGLLLSSGMDITDALDAVVIVFGNQDVERRFRQAAEEVRHGMTLAIAFDKYHLFPPIMVQMIAVGEKTAAIDDVLTRSCTFFDESVDDALSALTSTIQPVMLLLLGGIVGLLFIAIYSPMLAIMTSLT